MSALLKIIKEQSAFSADEQLYVSKSKVLMQLLKSLRLPYLYDPVISMGKSSMFADDSITNGKRLAEVQRLKIAYSLKKGKTANEEYTSLMEGIANPKVNARELIIYPFDVRYVSGYLKEAIPEEKGAEVSVPIETTYSSNSFNENRKSLIEYLL